MACVIRTCKSRIGCKTDQDETNISFHKFPTDRNVQNQWIAVVSPEVGWTPKKHHKICSKHFTAACFTSGEKWRRLTENAVPTLHLYSTPTSSAPSMHPTPKITLVPTESLKPIKDEILPQIYTSVVPTASLKHIKDENLPQTDTFVTSTKCVKCVQHILHINKLELRVEKLEKLAAERLLKVKSLRERARRLKKKIFNISSNVIVKKETNTIERENLMVLGF